MTKEELVSMGLSEEQADKVLAAHKEEMKEYVPKSRFNEVNEEKKTLKSQLAERDKQLTDLKNTAGDNEQLKQKIAELEESNKKASAEHEAQLKQLRIDHAVESALTSAKARNQKAVRALLNLDDVDIDDDGKIKGLDKQIKKLVESDDTKFLFESDDGKTTDAGGKPKSNLSGMNILTPPNGEDDKGSGQSLGASFAAKYNAMNNPSSTNGKE